MHIVKDALELRFRIDICQEDMLAEILATMNQLDLSPDNPNHERIFDAYIDRREHLKAVLKCAFEIASPWSFQRKRDKDAIEAETIWGSLRYSLWEDNPNKDSMGWVVDSNPPMQYGAEPVPKVERVDEG